MGGCLAGVRTFTPTLALVAIATRAAHEGLVPIGSLTAPQI
jgi:hypothetical protein